MSHEAIMLSLRDAVARRRLRPLDLAFAQFIAERDASATPSLILLAALLSRHLADGHPCLDLETLPALATEYDWPSEWLHILSDVKNITSTLLAKASGEPDNAPMVLDGERLYLRRYWDYECQVARAIDARTAHPVPVDDAITDELLKLFPRSPLQGQPNWPRIACALSARSAFSVITGGPGTGKTTTVVRLLGLLQTLHLRNHTRPLRMRLAAPTGKAAARLNASIATQLSQLDIADEVRAAVPHTVETLHRLLGARPDSRQFRHNRHHPLHVDVLVIDEASMIDLELMASVLDALPDHARLILLGDKDQLSSVEAGAILGDLCRRAEQGHYSVATKDWLLNATGDDVSPYIEPDAHQLDQQVTMLRVSHRFGSDSGIGQLASAVNAGDVNTVHRLLGDKHTDIAWTTEGPIDEIAHVVVDGGGLRYTLDPNGATPMGYRHYLEVLKQRPVADADENTYRHWAVTVLDAYNRFQLLCALRNGPSGTEGLNRRIAGTLLECGLIESDRGWYEGRPVMVTRNDYSLGLMNGDIGMTLRRRGPDGVTRLYVAFSVARMSEVANTREDTQPSIRFVLPSRLSDVDTVYAMTVHKSQGSEFEHTALVLPDDAKGALTRELLYTGITRARRWFSLISTQSSLDQAIAQGSYRYSGLTQRLARER